MNFIVSLLLFKLDLNISLIITCKFTKKILLLSRKDTWKTNDWINHVIICLMYHDWDISRSIISDRDSKFMSHFWIAIFIKLEMSMLTSIVYHSQIDNQSKRIHQTIEIVLRFHLIINSDDEADWLKVLFFFQIESNNVKQFATSFALNELAYDFKVNDTIDMLFDLLSKDYSRLRLIKREEIESIMIFVNVLSKTRYDRAHRVVIIKLKDKVYLRLHQGYIISNLSNHKLFNQRVDSFKIIERVDQLTFRLQLSSVIKIHLVISIGQLESITFEKNFYDRSTNRDSSSIQNEDFETSSYEIERLFDKRITHDRSYYLVKWKRYDNEHNVWYSIRALDNASKLIIDYEARQIAITVRFIRQRRSLRRVELIRSSFQIITIDSHLRENRDQESTREMLSIERDRDHNVNRDELRATRRAHGIQEIWEYSSNRDMRAF